MRKYSRQRETIRNYLEGRTDHPTAVQIYREVKKTLPRISLGTVYRNLNLLEEDNELVIVDCGDGLEHYDPNCEPHAHLYCTDCGTIIDFPLEGGVRDSLFGGIPHGCTAHDCRVMLRGICAGCAEKTVAGT